LRERASARDAHLDNNFSSGIPMHAIELKTVIGQDHEIHLKLPASAREGPARVIVLFDETGNLDGFLASLPLNAQGRPRSEIAQQVREERDSWGSEP
jgi:hypothetical protein